MLLPCGCVDGRSSRSNLDVQYYLMHADQSGWLFDYYLLKAADRGVRVRILLDDMDTAGRGFKLSAFDRHPNH